MLVKTDLRLLGIYESFHKYEILSAHFNALSYLIDLGVGTLIVSTASDSLCNTKIHFDPVNTPSERGILMEFIRKQKGTVRSYHPFMSYTAIGAKAVFICTNNSRHSFGLETPKDRMLKLDAMYLSVGLEPRMTCTYVHHVEMLTGVPYRYTKEFEHPVIQTGEQVKKEFFYMFILYKNIDIERNINKNLFRYYHKAGYPMKETSLGTGKVYGYKCVDFVQSTTHYLRENIYGWLSRPPTQRPFTQ